MSAAVINITATGEAEPMDVGQHLALHIYRQVLAQAGEVNATHVALGMATAVVSVMLTQFGEKAATDMLHVMLRGGVDALRTHMPAAETGHAAGSQPKPAGTVH